MSTPVASLSPADFANYFAKPPAKSDKTPGSYDSTMTEFEVEAADAAIREAGVEGTLTWSAQLWDRLAQAHYICPPKNPARAYVCQKIILNHEALLRDICNQQPVTQLQLVRVPPEHAEFADAALREVARRLLGKGGKHLPVEELVEGARIEQVETWSRLATYLSARIQSSDEERPGRTPDMTPDSADVLRAALQEMWFEAYAILRRRT